MKKNFYVFTALLACLFLTLSVGTYLMLSNTGKTVNAIAQYEIPQDENLLIPGGEAFGVKLYTDGCIVVEMSKFESERGTVCPAKEAGIKINDIIIAVNGKKIGSNEDIAQIVSESGSQPVTITLKRTDKVETVKLIPEYCVSQEGYKTGMWVRDSTAGIGTVTYFNPYSQTMAGLGHGISDVSTGILMPAAKGEIIGAQITDVKSGEKGLPGQLIGYLDSSVKYGELTGNDEMGIFAKISGNTEYTEKPLPAASASEAHTGDAYIISTVSDEGKACYAVKVESINPLNSGYKNMIIKITDSDLLKKTGGIVQGMSGSPIIQDGKIIGAITHVFVNDPTRGYGILIENMLNNAA